jgi:chaperonin GroES
MAFKPLGLRVLVERTEEENKTASGIIIPDNAKEKPLTAKIVAVSNEVAEDELLGLCEGQTILFAKYSGTEVAFDGKDYLVLNTDDILGIME